MKRRQIKIVIITFLTILILTNLPFLPGPNFLNGPAQLFFTIGQVVGMIGLLFVPIGIIWTAIINAKKQELFRPLFFTAIFLAPLMSLLFLTKLSRDFSRNIAVKNGNKLVRQIENYKIKNGNYPDFLDNSIFYVPHSWIIGVEHYNYRKTDSSFELEFNQNVLFGFNFEIVTFNNKNEQKTQGEQKTLYPTSDKKWKYEIYD